MRIIQYDNKPLRIMDLGYKNEAIDALIKDIETNSIDSDIFKSSNPHGVRNASKHPDNQHNGGTLTTKDIQWVCDGFKNNGFGKLQTPVRR